jgi:thiamine-monophosphate kinase
MTQTIAMGTGAEFDAIREMIERWGTRATGIGDDAAVIDVPRGDRLVASVDTAVENKHFMAEWLTAREISYRAVAAALSDLAAMASRPLGVLVAMTVPDRWRDRLSQLADGIGDALDVAGTTIRGGNLSDGSELSITTTVFGSAFAPLRRAGAKPGEHVYVTGALGAPATALRLFGEGKSAGEYRERFAHPVPRIGEAIWLADRGASAAIDISDGLVADAAHLATASGVCIELDASRVPRFSGVALETALAGAEEYELVITAAMELDAGEFARRFSLSLTRIGAVTPMIAGRPVVVHGANIEGMRGYDHFSR